ncbi:MAG: PilT/PilU family type 4a pilus ATPase [Gammaproteobacteria bacterium]|nr:PilT/PilU family type 4a pilus ATPase [Gammaproteobacteria bacterium]
MDIGRYLHLMIERQASDLFFSTGAPVCIKIEGVTKPVNDIALGPGEVKKAAYSLMNDKQLQRFEKEWELDLGVTVKETGRFRINVFRERGEVAMVVRFVRSDIPTIAKLNLPPILNDLVMAPRGLVLVVGAAGSGKSTTLASMVDHRARERTGHILTIEDPIEYVHHHRKSIVNQREVGIDTHSYTHALIRAMREAPDVILIGEIRDYETMQQAITYAETGHLCLSTLHASNSDQTLDRIINFFPETAHRQLFMDLSMNLKAVISQRLVTGIDGNRLPAVEVLLNTPYVQELILKGEVDQVKSAMEQGKEIGMQTFDQSLYELYMAGRIALDQALAHADSHNNLSLRIRLAEGGAEPGEGLSYEKKEA